MTVTVPDVEKLDATSWQSLDQDKKQALLDDAKRELETMYRGDTARFPTLQGDEQVFIKNLAAHKWELAEGGEPTSSNQTGGSTSYSTGNPEDYLSLTRFGTTCKRHIDSELSVGIVRSY
ncbi:adaptor [Haloquadratum phage sp.]|nr:adaptor [Haloquadratum phage sp.]